MKLNNSVDFDDGLTYIKGSCGTERDTFIDIQDLRAGTYALFAEVDWNESQDQREYAYVITRYGLGAAELNDITDWESRYQVLFRLFSADSQKGVSGLMAHSNMNWYGAPRILTTECKNTQCHYYFFLVRN